MFFETLIQHVQNPAQTIQITSQMNEAPHENLIQQMQQIDKVELHLHLGGSWPLEYLKKIADVDNYQKLEAMIDRLADGVDYHEAFEIFGLISTLVDTNQKVEDGVVALCKELAADRVTYVEIRTGLKDLGSGLRGYLEAVLRGIARGCVGVPLKVGLILSLRRDSSSVFAQQVIELAQQYRSQGIVGIDLSGDSTKGDGADIFDALAAARTANFPIALHLGESPKETAEQQMKELNLLQPARIGHGVHLCPEALAWIKAQKIPIELCITSAVSAGMIKYSDAHPILQLLRDNHPVVICTDDPLIFNTSLSRECAKVMQLLELTQDDIIVLQKKALQYKFDADENQYREIKETREINQQQQSLTN